eukprot:s153_g26.t1
MQAWFVRAARCLEGQPPPSHSLPTAAGDAFVLHVPVTTVAPTQYFLGYIVPTKKLKASRASECRKDQPLACTKTAILICLNSHIPCKDCIRRRIATGTAVWELPFMESLGLPPPSQRLGIKTPRL